jgi:hypothetical protein
MKDGKGFKNNLTIIVARINNKGDLRNSRPCKNCAHTLEHFRIKNIWYIEDHKWNYCRVRDLTRTCTTSAQQAKLCKKYL